MSQNMRVAWLKERGWESRDTLKEKETGKEEDRKGERKMKKDNTVFIRSREFHFEGFNMRKMPLTSNIYYAFS